MKWLLPKSTILVLAVLILSGAAFVFGQDSSIISRQQRLDEAKDHFSLGQSFIKEGNYSAANSEFAKAELMLQEASITQPDTASGEAEPRKEKAADENTQVSKATSHYLEEIKKETSSPDYYYNLGIDYLKKGQFVQAEESFKLTINLNPLDKDACYNLAVLYENYLGNQEKALKYYQQYLNINGGAADADQVKSWIKALKQATGAK
jgi:tetratricopeptide (TPR) repeat protein